MAITFITLLACMGFFVLHAITETMSRQTWAFARDNALIGSGKLQQLHPRLQVPVYALIATWALVAIVGVVFVASATGMY